MSAASRRVALAVLAGAFLPACAPAVRSAPPMRLVLAYENPLAEPRADEVLRLRAADLGTVDLAAGRIRAVDIAASVELPVQLLDLTGDGVPDELAVLASFAANERKEVAIEPAAPTTAVPPRVHVRHIPERDDMAWENDRVTFRTFGQGLWRIEPQTRSSGIDAWTKRTSALVIDRWYAQPGGYHQDFGEGADFYTVSGSLGAGGTGIWRDSLHRPLNFRSHRIIASGPIVGIFEVEYDTFDAGGLPVTETKRIEITPGQRFFRSLSTYRFEGVPSVAWATGTVKRAGLADSSHRTGEYVWHATWGPVDTRPGGHGDLGTAVVLDATDAVTTRETSTHYLVLGTARPGVPVTHWVGTGWTAGGDVPSRRAWIAQVDTFARRLTNPVRRR